MRCLERETMNEIETLKQRVDYLESVIKDITYSDRFLFSKTLQLQDGRNIQTGRGTGTKIGTAADQKIALYGETPIVQQNAIATPTVSSVTGSDTVDATVVGSNFTNLKTAIDSIRTALINIGITA